MKKYFIISALVLALQSFAVEKKVDSEIKGVTVFFQGAQITRTFKSDLVIGETELVLSQLEHSIRSNSIQVKGDGNFVIKSFFTRTNYLEPKDFSKELRDLETQLKLFNLKYEDINLELSVLTDEENLILNNRQLAGQQSGLKTEELIKAAAFYRTRLKAIRVEKLEFNRQLIKNNTERQKVQNQMNQIRSVRRQSVEELVIKIETVKAGSGEFTISYYVPSASWSPFYEVNVEAVNKPISLVYKANINQNTGVSWNNVKLTLSTTQPNLSGQIPSLAPWFLDFIQIQARRSVGYASHRAKRTTSHVGVGAEGLIRGSVIDANNRESLPMATVLALDANGNTITGSQTDFDGNFSMDLKQKAFTLKISYIGYNQQFIPLNGNHVQVQMFSNSAMSDEVELLDEVAIKIESADYAQYRNNSNSPPPPPVVKTYKASKIAEKATFFEYQIDGYNSVPSNNLSEVVHIQDVEINAKYEYQTVPKLDKDVFLVARIFGWEDYNLLNGAARLYFENTFVGESFLDVQFTQDTLGLSLGRDKNIVVSRDKVFEQSGHSGMGGNKKEVREFKIQIRNNKSQPVLLKVIDQYPVSTNKKITVKLEESSGAVVNKETGMLQWLVDLDVSEFKELGLKYNVVYPNDKVVNLVE